MSKDAWTKEERAAEDRRRNLICRMAGNIAPGFAAHYSPAVSTNPGDNRAWRAAVAADAVLIAEAIYARVHKEGA